MLELYHWEPNAESLALLICLKEKGLGFTSHYVDMMKLEHHFADYLAMSPKATVPVLIADGEFMDDTNFALLYLDERYPEPRLAPADPGQLYDAQAWGAWLSGGMMSVNTDIRFLGWNSVMLNAIPEGELKEFRDKVAALPKQLQSGWTAVWNDAEANEDQLANARERIQKMVDRAEQTLSKSGWLVGDEYSITDITAFSYFHTLPDLLPEVVNRNRTPNITKWLEIISNRPAVEEALALRKSPFSKDVYPAPGT